MNETRALAHFVVQTRFEDLPRALVDNLKITVLDALAAGFVGARQPWAQRIVAVVHDLGGVGEGPSSCTTGAPTSRAPPSPTACSSAPSSASR